MRDFRRIRVWLRLLLCCLLLVACGGGAPRDGELDPTSAAGGVELEGWFGTESLQSSQSALQRRYALEVDAQLDSVPGPGVSGGGTRLGLSGAWVITLLERQPEHALVMAQIEPRELDVTPPQSAVITPAEYTARMRAELGQPLLLKQDAAGRVIAVRGNPRTIAAASAVARAVAATAQISSPSSRAREWAVDEQDTAGRYRARYEGTPGGQVLRKKLEYAQVDTGSGLRAPAAAEYGVLSSEARFRVSAGGALESLEASEALRVEPGEGFPPFESRTSIRLALTSEQPVAHPTQRLHELAALPWVPLHARPSPRAHDFDLDLTKAAEYTRVSQILRDLARLDVEHTEGDADREQRLMIALTSLLRLKPSAMSEARSIVEGAAGPARHRQVVLRALASSGVPEAQALVLGLVREPGRLSPSLRGELLVALSLSRYATPELVNGLEQLLDDPLLGGQAMFGLGSAAFRSRDEEPRLARQALDILEERLEAATSAGSFKSARLVLRAFGNTGHPEILVILQPYLTSPQPPVRAAAVGALRRIADPEVDRLLAHYLTSDTDPDVRSAAERTLAERRQRKAQDDDVSAPY